MKIALVIFDKINLLNLARIRTFLESLESKPEIKICAFKSEISDEYGLKILPQIYGESLLQISSFPFLHSLLRSASSPPKATAAKNMSEIKRLINSNFLSNFIN